MLTVSSEACERNKGPILEVLRARARRLPSGARDRQRHRAARGAFRRAPAAAHLAAERIACASRAARRAHPRCTGSPNLRAPIALDVCAAPLAVRAAADAVFSANTLHIMAWHAVRAVLPRRRRAARRAAACCACTGRFASAAAHTSDSNAAVRRLAARARPAERHARFRGARCAGAARRDSNSRADHAMPANNRTLVWRARRESDRHELRPRCAEIRDAIRTIPDYPRPGRDVPRHHHAARQRARLS